MAWLAIVLAATSAQVTLLEPPWATGEISADARLLVIAEISSAESLEDVRLELRCHGRDWEPRAIPSSKQIRFPLKAVVAAAVEPRRIPGLQAGDAFEIRLRATYGNGESRSSETILVRLIEPELRERGLLDRLNASCRTLEGLRDAFNEDYRALSRLERRPEVADLRSKVGALEDRWNARLREILDAGDEFLRILEEAVTDRLVDGVREARYRKVSARLRACGSSALRIPSREALRDALDAEDQFISTLQKAVAEVRAWRDSLELRREVRALIQSQKGLNGELELERRRDREK